MASQFKIWNGSFATTASQLAVTTGTAIKTMLQVKGIAAVKFKVLAWGFSFDGAAAAAGVQVELLETGTIFGTVTASAAGDILPHNDSGAPASTTYFSVGTAATGYTCTAEGSIVATRVFDTVLMQPTGAYAWEFSLGREPEIAAISALRIRVKAAAAVNMLCWVLVEV